MLVQLFLYGSWKMNKKLIKIARKQEEKVRDWNLFQNQDYLTHLFLSLEKKSPRGDLLNSE
ncbi:hypothetical protein LCGC14_0729230 [marine sediment metagenome]|uniref:Uncharacterized protein n=1 Tax=marine sediment metagenome TaxID=412755 RepID=A0A0F9SVC9_9ZZZZ|nr:MAG: hypothetical protein Lokiarch_50630 [Candidatus Lokiarchaeum sp. GC14_75]